MHHNTTKILGIAILAALTTTALAQGGGGRGGSGGQGGGGRQGSTPPDPAQFIERMMANDANGDDKLSRDELPGRFAERMFDTSDTNGDGFVDRAELQTVAEGFAQRRASGQRPGQQGQPGQQPGVRPGAPEGVAPGQGRGPAVALGELDFEHGMDMTGRALRQLRRSPFDDESRPDDMRAIQAFQTGLLAAKGRVREVAMAPQAEARYGNDLVTYRSDLRLSLIQAVMESLALEAAVIEGDAAAAKESLAMLLEVRKESHEAFQPEDEDEDDIPEPKSVLPSDA